VISHLAQESHAWVVASAVGTESASPERSSEMFNSAGLIDPSGELVGRYDKVHLVPFGEYVPARNLFPFMNMLTEQVGNFAWGHSRMPLDTGEQKFGMAICYESIFPDEVRQSVVLGANVLLNVSNDGWYGDSGAWKQHLQMTQMRAIENGRWMLAATNTGVT